MNKIRVFADFHNADVKGRVRLNCAGTIADIERQGIALREGLSLSIYSEKLEVEGVVHYSEEEKLWTAVIDWNAIQEVEPVDSQFTIQDIIREIEKKSKGGGYIYRGESKCNPKVSSKLYRDLEIETGNFNIELVEKEMLAAAKKHTGDLPQDLRLDVPVLLKEETKDFEILTEIQHYGGKTNLIDFTTDYFVALFFACDGRYDKNGRVILQKIDEIRSMIRHPQNPRHRVIAQKSVFIRPPRGFIEPEESDIVNIPANLKEPLLQHLQDYHGISTEVIYNDIHGFIRNQNIHEDAYTHFYRGFACHNRADEASTRKEKQREYEEAIKHYTQSIESKPDFYEEAIKHYTQSIESKPDFIVAYYNRGIIYNQKGEFDNAINDYTKAIEIKPDDAEVYYNRGIVHHQKGEFDNAINDYTKAIKLKFDYADVYYNRGEAWLHLQEWEKARVDLAYARDNSVDIATSFHNDYESVADFKQKTGIQLPEDIAELLTLPTA